MGRQQAAYVGYKEGEECTTILRLLCYVLDMEEGGNGSEDMVRVLRYKCINVPVTFSELISNGEKIII